jgi:hypothetical protein
VNKMLIKSIAFMAGLYFLMEYVLPSTLPAWLGGGTNPFSSQLTNVNRFLMVLAGMAFFLGPINLTRSELRQIIRQRKGWMESVVFMIALILGILGAAYKKDVPETKFQEVMLATFNALFYGVNMSFYITSMGLVSFYLVSAAHRAFMLNNMESGIMMISATIVMFGLTPAGDFLSRFLPAETGIGDITQWIIGTPNTAVQKAVLFGACGGAFTAAMRNWLSLGKSVHS